MVNTMNMPTLREMNNEYIGVIALTSYKKRIHYTGLTIFSLICNCPRFHIVLTLSRSEFPKGIYDLPNDVQLLIQNRLCEVCWVKNNFKTFKKIVYAQCKYKHLPVISADDGCIYTYNYAQQLYNIWLQHTNNIISIKKFPDPQYSIGGGGYGVLYPPYCFRDIGLKIVECFGYLLAKNPNDDRFIGILASKMGIRYTFISDIIGHDITTFIDVTKKDGLSENGQYQGGFNKVFERIIDTVIQYEYNSK